LLPQAELTDWRRKIFEVYADIRRSGDSKAAWDLWKATRAELFATHPQSPLTDDDRLDFAGLNYFDYDPDARVGALLHPASSKKYQISSVEDRVHEFTRFAVAEFRFKGTKASLEVYWLEGYAGGIFLPFKDAGAGKSTYRGGRYLLDTAKGADLGMQDGQLVLDFNFAYQPSCSYSPEWACPLAPQANVLQLEVRAGERQPA